MGDKPPKPPPDEKNDVLGALESALLEARQRVSEAVEGLRAVMRGRDSGKLADDTGRYTRRPPKAKTVPPEQRKPKRR
jgi:hypothetical protein